MIVEGERDEIYDVIIIGAGLSGLTAADILLREEKKILILESGTSSGGIIKNYTIAETMKYLQTHVDWLEESKEAQNAYI